MRKPVFVGAILLSLMGGEAIAQTSTTTWNKVASEGQQFTLSGTQTIRYGSGSSWVQKSLSGTPTCSNTTFGKDPIVGTVKSCEIAVVTTAPTWTTVAAENQKFTLSTSKTVRYGAGSTWVQKTLSGAQTCSNTTFGKDPIVGVVKSCQVSSASTTTPPVTSFTAKLNWTPPSTRENGAPLAMSDLKGYEIYYTSDDLTQSVTVPVSGGSTASFDVANLKAGTYHFAISAIDSTGAKSKLSPLVTRTLGQ